MRKKSFAIILSLLLVLPLSISITSASYKDESNKEIYADDSNIGFSIMEAEKTKQITYRNKTFDVKYVNTINMSNILPENRKDSFCTYDIYSDEENTEYLFVYNTDILCGIKDENMSLPFDSAKCISQQSAILLSIEYLNKLYGYDITKSYVFDFCRYDENAGLFDVRFTNL